MDVFCPRCGEGWDTDCLHDEAQARYGHAYGSPEYNSDEYAAVFETVSREFRTQGCVALAAAYGVSSCEPVTPKAGRMASAASAAYDVLGGDLDGAAAMLDDFERGL